MPASKKNPSAHELRCNKCGSPTSPAKNGFRYVGNKETGEKEKVRRYKCKKCHRTFSPSTKIPKSDHTEEQKQVYRLILHLYISGRTKREIVKSLEEYQVEDVGKCIDSFFDEQPPAVRKFLDGIKADKEIRPYHQYIRKIAEKPKYSLYLQEGEEHLAYALFFRNMPSIVNILLDNLLDPKAKPYNHIREEIVDKLSQKEVVNTFEIADTVINSIADTVNRSPHIYKLTPDHFIKRFQEVYGYQYPSSFERRKEHERRELAAIEQRLDEDMNGPPIYLKKS